MGRNELEELRRQAEQAIADAECFTDTAGQAAIAKAIMYAGELLATRLEGPRTKMVPTPWVKKGETWYKEAYYAVYVNPETGEDELWQQALDFKTGLLGANMQVTYYADTGIDS